MLSAFITKEKYMSLNQKRMFRTSLCLSLMLGAWILFRTSASGVHAMGRSTIPAEDFSAQIQIGQGDELYNVQAGGFTFPIVQQPIDNPGFVSSNLNEVTQFRLASQDGNIGLLAHNYLAGKSFSQLAIGDKVQLVYGEDHTEDFIISIILRFQALQPNSAYSSFKNLDTGEIFTAEQLFNNVYGGSRHLTFQTCIEAEGNVSWGRLFVIATPGY